MRSRTAKRATTPWKRLACFWCELGENLLRIEAWTKASSSLMAVRRKDLALFWGELPWPCGKPNHIKKMMLGR